MIGIGRATTVISKIRLIPETLRYAAVRSRQVPLGIVLSHKYGIGRQRKQMRIMLPNQYATTRAITA